MRYSTVKRSLDIIVSVCATPVLLAMLPIVALAIKIEDGGPVFYPAIRRGRNGKPFKMYKFRSMVVNAPDIRNADNSTFNSTNDSRVTKVGKFLRKTSIDELPQIWNVLIGDMSLVGPRPHMATRNLQQLNKKEIKRLLVRPGITGYAQALYRNSITADEKCTIDCFYVENMNFILDIKVIGNTFKSIFKSRNIYNANNTKNGYPPPGMFQQKVEDIDYLKLQVAVILGASILQIPMIKKAKELGYYVIALDHDPNALGARIADEFRQISTLDEIGVEQVVRETHANLLTTAATDAPMRVVAAVCNKLNLPSISPQTAAKVTDKGKMIHALEKMNVPVPRFEILNSEAEIKTAYEKISSGGTKPVILKPVNSSGSRGVIKVNPNEDLHSAFSYSQKAGNGTVVISEFMNGPEVSVEVFSSKTGPEVVTITDKTTSGNPHFVEIGHSQPSLLNLDIQTKIEKIALEAVNALEIHSGPAHVEIIVDQGTTPKIVEVGARLGGDFITSHLVPLSTGFDMVTATLKAAAGEEISVTKSHNSGVAIQFITCNPGIITSINLPDSKLLQTKHMSYELQVTIGDHVPELKASNDRLGYVICSNKSVEVARQHCKEIVDKIDIQVSSADR